jgi:hypothetical protein
MTQIPADLKTELCKRTDKFLLKYSFPTANFAQSNGQLP